jgi:uncharacterized protein YbaA (DUF1428 family)
MAYVDGFVIAVPTANKEAFIDMSKTIDSFFIKHGATRVLECWGDDVPDGTLTDFRKAVQAKDDETVVFSWIEWPDKATRDTGMARLHDAMVADAFKSVPMAFDGKRMIFGGFVPVLTLEK